MLVRRLPHPPLQLSKLILTFAGMVAYTVTDKASGEKIGNVAYLNIVPQMRRIEIGSIWYPPFPLNLLFRARCSVL